MMRLECGVWLAATCRGRALSREWAKPGIHFSESNRLVRRFRQRFLAIEKLFVFDISCRRTDAPALGTIENSRVVWTRWSELAELVEARTSELAALGVRTGDRVAQCGPNSRAWIVNDLALAALGAVHVPLHAANTAALNAKLIDHADVRLVIGGDGRPLPDSLRETTIESPAHLASLIYTSGTTGEPLGVMLSRENLVANAEAVSGVAGGDGNETRLAILPFSHAYARTCDLNVWLLRGSRMVLSRGREHLLKDLQIARPTAIVGVPYLFEKLAGGASGDALRALLGGAIRRCYSGGAPLSARVVEQFEAAGVPLADGYGLTEAAPVVSMSSPADREAGTVGRPLPNVEVNIGSDGELLVRAPSVMLGYWRNDAASAEALADGWLHTGDLAELTPTGHVRIVGRRKELIALSTGKKVAPATIEAIIAASPLVEQVCVCGDGLSHLVALVVPNPTRIRDEISRRRLWVWSKRRAVSHPAIRELFRCAIAESVADLPAHERPGDFTILTRGFSIDAGEMTAKLSLCRAVIAKTFAKEIARLTARSHRAGRNVIPAQRL